MIDGRQLAYAYFKLLDEKNNHHMRCSFPKQEEFKAAEATLRKWALPPTDKKDVYLTDTCITGAVTDYVTPHASCPVVVGDKVCMCDCRTCKRAWFADGQPCVRDGKIIRRP